MLNHPEISKAGILKTLYPTPLNFLTAHKFGPEVDEELKKQRLTYYLSKGYKLLVLASTIKTKEEESAPKPVTSALLLLPFEEVKGLNAKILHSLFLFGGNIPEAKREDFKSDKSMSSADIFITNSPLKHKTRKAFKKSHKKKLKIEAMEPLTSNKTKRQKGKAAIIAEANGKEIVGKPQPKQKIKCLCYFKTPAKCQHSFHKFIFASPFSL